VGSSFRRRCDRECDRAHGDARSWTFDPAARKGAPEPSLLLFDVDADLFPIQMTDACGGSLEE